MNPDIRPQDDLFGHVNGRWLDETEIPGRPLELGPLRGAGRQRGGAGPADHRGPGAGRRRQPRRGRPQDRRPLRVLHGRGGHQQARAAAGAPAHRRGGGAPRHPRPRGVPRRVRAGRRARHLRLLRQHRRPQLRPLPVPDRPGRARAARRVLLPRRQVRRDPRQVRRLPHRALHPRRARRPGRRGRDGAADRHPAGRGPLGAGRDPRRAEDLQPDDLGGAEGALPGLRLGRLRHQPRWLRGDHRRGLRRPAVLPRAPLDGPRGGPDRGLEGVDAVPRAAVRCAVPHRRVRRDQLRLLRPHPQRHPRAAARGGSAGSAWSRARSAKPSASSTSSATSRRRRRRRWTPWSPTCSRPTGAPSPTSTG